MSIGCAGLLRDYDNLRGDYKEKYSNCAKCRFWEFQSSEDLTPYREELIEKYEKLGYIQE